MGSVDDFKMDEEHAAPEGLASKADGATFCPIEASHRRFDRFPWKTHVQVLWFEEHNRGTSVTIATDDLGAGGIGLVSSSWIQPGRFGAVLLSDRPGHRFIRWFQVLHARYVPARKAHVLGCKWIHTPEYVPTVRIVESASGPQLVFDTHPSSKSAA